MRAFLNVFLALVARIEKWAGWGRRTAGWVAIAVPLVAQWEGLATTAYADKIGHGVPTVCYGMTSYDRPVKVGDHYTKEQCQKFLGEDLLKYNAGISKCIHVPITDNQRAAAVSLAYNIGVGAVCKSTFVKKLNAKDPNACQYILAYNKSMGQYRQGLANRRQAEYKICKGASHV